MIILRLFTNIYLQEANKVLSYGFSYYFFTHLHNGKLVLKRKALPYYSPIVLF